MPKRWGIKKDFFGFKLVSMYAEHSFNVPPSATKGDDRGCSCRTLTIFRRASCIFVALLVYQCFFAIEGFSILHHHLPPLLCPERVFILPPLCCN